MAWEMRNQLDYEIGTEDLKELMRKFPELRAVVMKMREKEFVSGFLSDVVASSIDLDMRYPEAELAIAEEGEKDYRDYFKHFFDGQDIDLKEWKKAPAMSPPSVHYQIKGLDKLFLVKLISWAESPGISQWEDIYWDRYVKIIGHDQLQTHWWSDIDEFIDYLKDQSYQYDHRKADEHINVLENMFDGELDWAWEQANDLSLEDNIWAEEYLQEIIKPLLEEIYPDLDLNMGSMFEFLEDLDEMDERKLGFTPEEMKIALKSALVDGFASGVGSELYRDFTKWFTKWFTNDGNFNSEIILVMDPVDVARIIEEEVGLDGETLQDPIIGMVLEDFPTLNDTLSNSIEWDKKLTAENLRADIEGMLRHSRYSR